MRISLFNNGDAHKTKFAKDVVSCNLDNIGQVVCTTNWSPFVFDALERMHRIERNFVFTDCLVLDIDGGCSIEEAKSEFSGYRATFLSTRNHQKIKNQGLPSEKFACDRFRVVIPFEKTIFNKDEYKASWAEAKSLWPFIDGSCSDLARFYYPSVQTLFRLKGKPFPVFEAKVKSFKERITKTSKKGQLFAETKEFLINGSKEDWHDNFFKATADLRDQNYSKKEATQLLKNATLNFLGDLDNEDIKQIHDIYNRPKKYSLRTLKTEKKWEQPVPIMHNFTPPMDCSAFPKPLYEFIKEESEYCETPISLSAMCALGTTSLALSGKFWTEAKPGYVQPLNLFLIAALESGNRKTSMLNSATLPIDVWEKNAEENMKVKIAKAICKRANDEAIIKKLRNKLSSAKADGAETLKQEIQDLELNLTVIPKAPRLLTSDITPERLGTLMSAQNGTIGVFSDEGGIFDLIGGRYNSGISNLDLYLKSYDGSPCRIDRQNGQAVQLKEPLITTTLCPQPSVIHALNQRQEFRSRGLIARFLYAIPDSNIGSRSGDTKAPSSSARSDYNSLVEKFLNIKRPQTASKKEKIIPFDNESQIIWQNFWLTIEKRMLESGDLYYFKDWGSKFPGTIARVAAIFQIIQTQEKTKFVTKESILRALSLSDFFISHAKKAFDLMEQDPHNENAKRILSWISRKQLSRFTRRECHKELQSRFKTVEPLKIALNLLEERGYVRAEDTQPKPHRPTHLYLVNPYFLGADHDT